MPNVILPDGKGDRTVKNLGWILRHRHEVESIHVVYEALLASWTLKDGRIFYCTWADRSVMNDWMLRFFPEQWLAFQVKRVTSEARKEVEVATDLICKAQPSAALGTLHAFNNRLKDWQI